MSFNKKIKNFFTILTLFIFPLITLAQFKSGVTECAEGSFAIIGGDFRCSVSNILDLIYLLVPILFGIAFIVFFWGLSKFILNSGSSPEIEKGKQYMFWGILALFVLISVETIVNLIAGDLFDEGGGGGMIPLLKE